MKTDIQIARECKLDHISEIASRLVFLLKR